MVKRKVAIVDMADDIDSVFGADFVRKVMTHNDIEKIVVVKKS